MDCMCSKSPAFDAQAAAERVMLQHEAELRWLYDIRAKTEPRIRELEAILGLAPTRAA